MRRKRRRAALIAAALLLTATALLTLTRPGGQASGLSPLAEIRRSPEQRKSLSSDVQPAVLNSKPSATANRSAVNSKPSATANRSAVNSKPSATADRSAVPQRPSAASEPDVPVSGNQTSPAATPPPASVSPLAGCQCRRRLPPGARRVPTSCAGFAARRGPRQHVVSFSWFGGVDSAYFRGIAANAAHVPRYYPGWVMRVYYRDPGRKLLPWLCPLVCRYPHLDLCEVSDLPDLGHRQEIAGVLWRFLPLADRSVERFICRDLDSLIGQRESDAVQEWIRSDKTIHVMRDHPLHAVSILAGAWGAWNHRNDIYRPVRERLVAGSDTAVEEPVWGEDQDRLAELVYGPASAQDDILEHDSYFCGVFGASLPFPSRRDLSTYPHFVGDRVMLRDFEKERSTREDWLFYIRKCPLDCRPRQNLDWLWC